MLRALTKYSPYEPMTADDVITRFPTIAKDHAHPATSAKYKHIGTAGTLRHMEAAGFRIHGVTIQGSRDGSGRAGYQKHMITLRFPGLDDVAPGTTPEILMRNAHDGCGAYALFAGMFRAFCWNGMVIGSTWGAFKVSHVGQDINGRVLKASHDIVDSFSTLRDVVSTWQGIELSPLDQLTFANEASRLRFFDVDKETGELIAPVAPAQINFARRPIDQGNSLWLTYNRVQENLITGGIYGKSRTGRNVKLRGLKAIDENVRINRQLFSLAESFAANKASPNVAALAAFAS